jgi:hypothetical protein
VVQLIDGCLNFCHFLLVFGLCFLDGVAEEGGFFFVFVDLEFQIVDFLVASDQLVLGCDLAAEFGLVPLPYV